MHRFVTLTFSGLTNVEAYRIVYDRQDETDKTVAFHAAELANHPVVLAKIKQLRAQAEQQSTLSAIVNRDFVINGLTGLALNADKDSTRLQAYNSLGKMVGIDLFRDVVVHQHQERSVEDVDRDLRAKLEALRNGLMIEGNAQDVTPEQPRRDRRRKPAGK